MGKRSAAEANVGDDHDDRAQLLESPVPGAIAPTPSVEPAGGQRSVASNKQLKLPLENQAPSDNDDDEEEEEDDQVAAMATHPPPLIAPRPRRVVSPELIFQPPSDRLQVAITALTHRRCFRPIGAGRPDVEITSPPSRTANPVAMDVRFQSLQKLNLSPTLQPFHRPCPQRGVLAKPGDGIL